jgi:CBS-domain-containing membrane protein
MTGGVEVIQPDNTLDEAAADMKRLDIGLLPVCDGNQLVGILTDRDIAVPSVAQSEDPASHQVRDIMTPDAVSCFEDQDVAEVARLMQEKRIRRVLVLNRDQRLVGVVSLGDLAKMTGNEQLAGETLERVSDPTPPKADEAAVQVQPEVVHARSRDPDGQALLTAGQSESPFVPNLGAPESGDDQPGAEPQPPQELLSEIKDVAQKVGGWKQLSEIAVALEIDGGVCGS